MSCPSHSASGYFHLWVFFQANLFSQFLHLPSSSWVTLHILRTQLFSAICLFSSCLSVSASVPNPCVYRLVPRRLPTLFLLVVSSVFCPHNSFHSPPCCCCCSCLHSPLSSLTTSSILTHCAAQVYKTVYLFNGLSVNNYM